MAQAPIARVPHPSASLRVCDFIDFAKNPCSKQTVSNPLKCAKNQKSHSLSGQALSRAEKGAARAEGFSPGPAKRAPSGAKAPVLWEWSCGTAESRALIQTDS